MAAKKKTPNKSDFIRSQPGTLSANEVVTKAKAAGLTILPGLVYEVRRAAKAKAAKANNKGGAAAKKTTEAAAPKKDAKPATAQKSAPQKPVAKKAAAQKPAAKKAGAANKPGTHKPGTHKPGPQSKADFVRGLGSLSAKEVVEKAKAIGMKLDAGYVYNVRASTKKASKGKTATKSAPRAAAPATKAPLSAARSAKVEDLLTAVASEIGLGRAIDILTAERAKVRAALG